ncbi:MAG: DUF2334 domain-containing protein [Clostridium sp.]
MAQQVVFRLDDICEKMNYDKFIRMKTIFDKYGVKPIIGVVPKNEDEVLNFGNEIPGFWEMVRMLQNDGWSIAQHGYKHVYVTNKTGLISLRKQSEFVGLPYEEQYEKIKAGKEQLLSYGIETDIFMAPSHSFDKNTLLSLNKCGFRYVTDGCTNHAYNYMGLTFIPCKEAKPKRKNRFSTVCLHTNWTEDKIYEMVENFISENRSKVITFETAKTLPQKPYWISRIEEFAYILFQKYIISNVYYLYKLLSKK